MKLNLKLRYLSAYFSPNKPIVADNEAITIEILDKGRFRQRTVLLFNGKAYLCENKKVTIPREELQDINVCELQEREFETDKILHRVTVENLLVIPCLKEYEGNRLVTERVFYANVVTQLLKKVEELENTQAAVNEKVSVLENGKFTILKFGGKENERV